MVSILAAGLPVFSRRAGRVTLVMWFRRSVMRVWERRNGWRGGREEDGGRQGQSRASQTSGADCGSAVEAHLERYRVLEDWEDVKEQDSALGEVCERFGEMSDFVQPPSAM